MTMTEPSEISRFSTAAKASSSQSKTRAGPLNCKRCIPATLTIAPSGARLPRSEEHTSELQSLLRISYAVMCLNKKNNKQQKNKLQINIIKHKCQDRMKTNH